ncbi:glycosyltransferase [Pseudomonas fulva]|uniref:glycosyltransferase n=1 Tax=Pseudomonas fulva TaxID=47880 RepID=UPI00384D1621
MSKSVSESLVSPEWYLAAYPDVAASGMSPQEHYSKYGVNEGRIPRLLRSFVLESAMWGGFSKLAILDLIKWQRSSTDYDEKSYACWALARWYSSAYDWSSALKYVNMMTPPISLFINRTGYAILKSEVLLHNGHHAASQKCIQDEIEHQGTPPDLCLIAANVRLRPRSADNPRDDLKLYWINRMFDSVKLHQLVRADQSTDLTIDNLRCAGQADSIWDEDAKISVVMPTYNSAQYIQTALISLLAQTWTNLEILVVDDCSTDDTAQVVLELAKQDSRIKYLRQQSNKGSYAARNTALQYATGTFVVNHDSDDWSHSQRLELMVRPLKEDTSIIATMANWARCEPDLHFQTWRIENHLVEPSVSTMMFRTEAIRRLGGWDEVRVAADYELYSRLMHYYGSQAVADVLPGTPLVFARQCLNSLTMAPTTHVRTSLFGLRKLYTSLAETWRSTIEKPSSLQFKPGEDIRPFPAPPSMLNKYTSEFPTFDRLVIGDFSDDSIQTSLQKTLLTALIASGARVAVFHWPNYLNPKEIRSEILSLAVANKLTIILAEQTVYVPYAIVVGSHLLEHPLDDLPVLKGYRGCNIVDSEEQAESVVLSSAEKSLTSSTVSSLRTLSTTLQTEQTCSSADTTVKSTHDSANSDDVPIESLFDAEWYLERYPDVSQSGIDPREHYINNGYNEGREPGPNFNTAWYLQQCPTARSSGLSPLVHYEKIGRSAGYDPRHPTLEGSLPLKENSPTILICAHAADTELFGAERSLLDVLDSCNDLQLNVIVSVPSLANANYVNDLRSRALAVTCVFTQPWNSNTPPCLVAVEKFRLIIEKHNVDLVQVNTIMLREPLLAAQKSRVPSVIHAHESPMHDAALCGAIGLDAEQVKAHVLEASDYIIANSEFTGNQLHKPHATYIAGNIIDAKAFNIPNTVNKEKITAALISSNLPKKGIQDLLRLALELSPDTPNIELLLIGPETPAISALKKLEGNGQLPKNISLIPYTSSPQDAVSKANIVLNLSHCQETFGRTLLEGMAAGRPVLAYRWGALPELIEDGVQGHILEFGDIKAVANRIRQLCRNPKKIRTLGAAGRKRAKQYNLKRLSKQLGSAYGEILGFAKASSTQKTARIESNL